MLKKDFESSNKQIQSIEEVVLNKKKSNEPTIFDLLYNKIADNVRF